MHRKLLIIDNSIAFTGAFKCAFTEAGLLLKDHEIFYILPTGATLDNYFEDKRIKLYKLPLLEISKSIPRLLKYVPRLLVNAYKLSRIIKRHNIDVVQVNDYYNLLGVVLKISGSKVKIITYVRFLPQALPSVLNKVWSYLACKYSAKVICVSDAVLKQMPRKENVVRIYDPVVFNELHSNMTLLPVHEGRVTFTYIGNYITGKGHNFAIEAFHEAFSKNDMIRLQFAGGDMGLEKNKLYRQSLEDRVKQLGLSEVVSFLPFVKDIEHLIKTSDVILNFSEAESFSMTCVEASYYGRPLVASRCGGPEEIVAEGKTGLLVENRNIAEMTTAILKMASLSPEERDAIGANGRSYVKAKFNEQDFISSFTSHVLSDRSNG